MTLDTQVVAYIFLVFIVFGILATIEMGARRSGSRWAYIGIRLFAVKGYVDEDLLAKQDIYKTIKIDADLNEFGFEVKQLNPSEYLIFMPMFLGWFQRFPSESLRLSMIAWFHPVAGRMQVDRLSGVVTFRVYLSMSAIVFSVLTVLSGTVGGYYNGKMWLLTTVGIIFIIVVISVYTILARLRVKEFIRLLILSVDNESAKYKMDGK